VDQATAARFEAAAAALEGLSQVQQARLDDLLRELLLAQEE
jgi:hypothetical protein